MHRGDGGGGERLHNEVAVGDGIERIGHRRVEAQRLRRHVSVDRERGSGERRGAERTEVPPLARIREPAAVARGHLYIGEQMVAEGQGCAACKWVKPGITVAACSSAFSASARW